MNFLAHCALAADAAETWSCTPEQREGLLAGAVLGDFVKGYIPTDWPLPLQAGTRLHRKVDALSNRNPAIRTTCNRFPAHLRRYAPIFVDMLADHCLSHSWDDYYDHDLDAFTDECYHAIDVYAMHLSGNADRFLDYMKEVDLLANYHQWPHITRGLASVLRRLDRAHWLEDVDSHSYALVADSQEDFAQYFPQLRSAWQSWNAFSV
ncbi:MAG: ACP phosphodiesterase [Pseudomonadales bacterium]|jgi:acyl carrier protein phosphodiesterase|nr:ACP phosphodiesterase [Pseudomonadales bacterium]